MWGISYWIFPIISSLCWLGTILGLLIHWNVIGKPHYPSMDPEQHIAYISDVGAYKLKPLFIAGACVTTIFLDLSFASERWLRHRGRLAKNLTISEKVLSGLSMVAALVGTAGLILLSIFDTYRHPKMHDGFLLLFLGGYVLSAIFICWEYQRLGIHFRQHRILRASFWIKLAFILVEVALAVVFIVTNFKNVSNVAAVLEWAIAFIFTFYVMSFFIDLIPAVHTSYSARKVYGADGNIVTLDQGRGKGARDEGWNGQTEMQQEANDPESNARSQSHSQGHPPSQGHGYGAYGHGGVGHHAHGGYANTNGEYANGVNSGYPEGRRTAESQRTLGGNDVRTVNGVKYSGQRAPMDV